MKFKKTAIAMGLASVVLTGCNWNSSSSVSNEIDSDEFTITAIDGYIVKGVITTTCTDTDTDNGTTEFKGVTNESGQASFSIAPYDTANCSSSITGTDEAGTYDADAPDDTWTHTMNTLAGLNIINPFTDIASTLSKIPGNESLTQDQLKAEVLALLGYSDSDDLFTDYSNNANVALLAQAVFDVTIQTLAALGDDYSAANMEALYEKILPNVVTAVNEAIELAENNGSSISTISISLNLGTLSINADGSVDTDTLNATVEAEVIYTDDNVATGATGGTGAVSSSTGG